MVAGESAPLTAPEPAQPGLKARAAAHRLAEVVVAVVVGVPVFCVLLALGAAIVAFVLVLVGFSVLGLSQLLGTPLSHIPVDLNRDLQWGEMVSLVSYGLAGVLVGAPVGFGLYALACRTLPLAGRRVLARLLGVTVLIAVSAGAFWAAFKGSGSGAAFGVGIAAAISAFRAALGLPFEK
jgi:hypothetical protein